MPLHPPAALTISSGWLSCHACSRAAGERLDGLGAGEAELPVNHEERDAGDAQGAAFLEVQPDVVGVFVGGEQFLQLAGVDAQVQAQGREVLPAADVLAPLEVVAEQAFLGGVLLPCAAARWISRWAVKLLATTTSSKR